MEPENARADQVLDASNFWVQDGKLVKRPGAKFAGFTGAVTIGSALADASLVLNSTLVTGSDDLLDDGTAPSLEDTPWYIGTSALPTSPVLLFDIDHVGGSFGSGPDYNLALGAWTVEYWNGTAWTAIDWIGYDNRTFAAATDVDRLFKTYGTQLMSPDPTNANDLLYFGVMLSRIPSDWATTTVASTSRYWVRITPASATFSGGIGSTSYSVGNWTNNYAGDIGVARGAKYIQTSGGKYTVGISGTTPTFYSTAWPNKVSTQSPAVSHDNNEPATFAVIPEFEKIYTAYDHQVYELPLANPGTSSDFRAQYNSDPFVTGDGALYDPDPTNVAQLDAFPKAKYITYFKGRLWAAGIKDDPFAVYWSAPALSPSGFAADVWPATNFETLAEDDNSPITGLATLNEHLIVFKQDSIWQMTYNGNIPDTGEASYVPLQMVSGVGCVSQASIANVNGRLIFLAEDGFYQFDGTPNVVKLSGNIDEKIASIVAGRRKFSTAVHWRTKNVYMCAVSIDGSRENDFVFVYDYLERGPDGLGAWWFWDGFSVQSWLKLESNTNDEQIFYGDDSGRLFHLTPTKLETDDVAITSTVTTHRWGYGDGITKRWRDCRLWSNNLTENATLALLRYDEEGTGTAVDFEDELEAKWDSGTWDTSTWVGTKRRERKLRVRETSEWLQLKITHSGTEPFELYALRCGMIPMGIR